MYLALSLFKKKMYLSLNQETGLGLEHHLHRGRALAAFNRLLGLRIEKLKLEDSLMHGQSNVQSDVQILLSPITQSEESLVSFVSDRYLSTRALV